eukprot:CAMPEP_0206555102 /NCGR_PEP_ID=MMETSP0325_2-20121206/17582_1 /ASSEMBLY_ACC=CAM_ASM_000347 /TAXON_ID=2866 /ORGANISM="Crypthecodinium cohnii, Strain Seligo" /LENGTH=52 /DNA_ID=CAMNT_0054055315 /DNA_START=183 /DNA_END=338 /DNA_ORIENTATION=-
MHAQTSKDPLPRLLLALGGDATDDVKALGKVIDDDLVADLSVGPSLLDHVGD